MDQAIQNILTNFRRLAFATTGVLFLSLFWKVPSLNLVLVGFATATGVFFGLLITRLKFGIEYSHLPAIAIVVVTAQSLRLDERPFLFFQWALVFLLALSVVHLLYFSWLRNEIQRLQPASGTRPPASVSAAS